MTEENFTTRTLYRGDNLPFLRGMNSGTVDLIATDPPFNKGRDFHATPDSLASGARFQDRWSWERDVHEEWVDQIKDDWPGVMSVIEAARTASGDDMAAFLCFMGVRLIAMRRVLKPTGSIYLHCDPTADYWLRGLMDSVFGRECYRNAITWQRNDGRGKGSQYRARAWGANTDTILFYVRSTEAEVRPYREMTVGEIAAKFPLLDGDGRRYYTGIPIFRSKSMGARPNLCFEWRGFTNPHPSGWRLSRERLEEEYRKGNVVIRDDGRLERRKYLDDYEGAPMDNCWTDIPRLAGGKERVGYPTQKPLALYERIIKASSNEGDVVLDPFAGCATTPVAAEKLGRRWVAMDIWEGAHDMVRDRIQNEVRLNGGGEYEVHLETKPPVRTDAGEDAVPFLRLPERRPSEPWQRLTRKVMADELAIAQRGFGDGIVCAGCGRERDLPEMELDHRRPRTDGGDNWITNRVLLCGPCNRRKGAGLTMTGLVRANKKDGWTRNADAASRANAAAIDRAESIRERGGIEQPAG